MIHLPIARMKKAVINQLKDNLSVWFSAEESTTLDYEKNILDDKTYGVYPLLHIKNLSKRQKILLDLISYDHAMCITGALVSNGEIKQFKVDNSFGNHGKYKGQLIMQIHFLNIALLQLFFIKNI